MRAAALRRLDLARDVGHAVPGDAPPALWTAEGTRAGGLAARAAAARRFRSTATKYLPQPVEFSDAPLEWSEAEFAELRYPPIAIAIEEQAAAQAVLYARLRREGGPEAASVTAEERDGQQCAVARPSSVTRGVRRGPRASRRSRRRRSRRRRKSTRRRAAAPRRRAGQILREGRGGRGGGGAEGARDGADADARRAQPRVGRQVVDALPLDAGREALRWWRASRWPGRAGAAELRRHGQRRAAPALWLCRGREPHDTFADWARRTRRPLERNFASEAEMRRRFGRLEKLGLGDALTLELRADASCRRGRSTRCASSARRPSSTTRRRSRSRRRSRPSSVRAALRLYRKLARNAMGGPLKADLGARPRARPAPPPRDPVPRREEADPRHRRAEGGDARAQPQAMTGSREGRGVDKSLCRARRVHTAQSPRLDTPRAREPRPSTSTSRRRRR